LLAPIPGFGDGIRQWRAWLSGRGRLLAACAATVLAVYLPHAVAVGPQVLGFLPGYLSEEGYGDGYARFALLRLLLPHRLAAPAGVLIMVVLATVVTRRTDPRRPWSGALVLTGIGLAIAGDHLSVVSAAARRVCSARREVGVARPRRPLLRRLLLRSVAPTVQHDRADRVRHRAGLRVRSRTGPVRAPRLRRAGVPDAARRLGRRPRAMARPCGEHRNARRR
jgi:hypothetical protein